MTLEMEKIFVYAATMTVVAAIILIFADFVTTDGHKAIATNATVAAANVTLGTPQLIATQYDKTTSVKPTVVNGTHGVEATFAGNGVHNGVNATDSGKAFVTNITDGVTHTEGQGVLMSKNGMATFIFLAVGQSGTDGTSRDIGIEFYPKATGNLASLGNTIAVLKDYIDKDGNAVTKLWEFR